MAMLELPRGLVIGIGFGLLGISFWILGIFVFQWVMDRYGQDTVTTDEPG